MSLNIETILLIIFNFIGKGSGDLPGKALLFWERFSAVSTFISLLLIVVVVYSLIRISQIRRKELEQYKPIIKDGKNDEPEHLHLWNQIVEQTHSDNLNDWRAAVIDADKILEDIVERLNLPGETLGERLKTVEQSDFRSINEAWEAHKVRNKIAHEANYQLTQREARRAIEMYRQVFEEFHYL